MRYSSCGTGAGERFASYKWLAIAFCLAPGGPQAQAQSATNIAVGSTVLQPATRRLGINLGQDNYYDSGQLMKNLIFRNPGFEGEIYQSTIRCAGGTATSCTDENVYTAWPAGFWDGASYQFFWGSANGRSGTVSSSTAPGASGVTLNFNNSGTVPANGDYLIVRKTTPGGVTAGWWPSVSGGSITTESADLPPGTTGKQAARFTALGSGQSAALASYFDSTAGHSFTSLNGAYVLRFKAKGAGGSNAVQVTVNRNQAGFLNQTLTLAGAWSDYSLPFTAVDTPGVTDTAGVTFATSGQSAFLLDDVSLTPASGDASNATAFRDPVVNTLKTLQPGLLRYWADQLGETMDNLIADPYARMRAGFSTFSTGKDDVGYGLHEFLQLCQALGADPWIVVPIVFTPAEGANLIEYLAGSAQTPYGAKRAARGQSAAWTNSFAKIHLEFGNEAWNSTFKGGNIEYSQPYGNRAQTVFAAMRASSSYNPASFDLALSGQAVYAARNQDIQNNCNNNDSFTVAPYQMFQVDNYASNEELFGPLFAEPELSVSPGGYMTQNQQAIQASSHPVPLEIYEVNLHTTQGAISQTALDQLTPSMGAGLAVADNMLLQMRQGIINQMLWQLPQYAFQRSDGKIARLWGAVVDMGVTNRMRPQFLALQLVNQAISGSMLQTAHSGADPVWNQPLLNGVQFNNAHYLQSFAFAQGSNRSIVLLNLHRTQALPVTFSGVNAPAGTVNVGRLTSANITDSNEFANNVGITSATLSSFNPALPYSLPPYSISVLTWTPSGSPPPVISNVAASAITSAGATVTWTTSTASNSEVDFGTTTAYGSTQTSAALVTAHSVTLTGLIAGTLYDYAVKSADSGGGQATSANFTFTTLAGAPVISAVSASAITAGGATITWTTSIASNSTVEYGTTTAYGSTQTSAAMVTSHSVALTGLAPGTLYNFRVRSTDAGGNQAVSGNSAFNTVSTAGGPVVSALRVFSVTTSGAQMTWSTSTNAVCQVSYGTTAGLGQSTPLETQPAPNHYAALSGLAHGTTYYFQIRATDAHGMLALSPVTTFSTVSAAGPVISNVSAGPAGGTTAVVRWTTDKPAFGQVVFGSTTQYGIWSASTPAAGTNAQITLPWAPSGTVHFMIRATDTAGNLTVSPDYTFTMP